MKPGSPEWSRLVTASKVAAILGVSPWESQRSIWHIMHGGVSGVVDNEATRRGHYLEPAILAWWRDQHPEVRFDWAQQVYTLGNWAAATPDLTADLADESKVLVEAKSAANMDDWGDEGTDVIPAYYLVQVYWQMHVSGVHRCYVPVIGPRLRFAEYVVDYEPEIGTDLEARMRAFYDTLAADEPPPLDDSVATFEVIRKLHPEIDRGESVELTYEEALAFADAINDEANSAAYARHMRSLVIDRMGRAQYATYQGVRIARRQPNKTGVSFVPIATHPSAIPEKETAA